MLFFFFCCFKQKTAYEMRIRDWSSDVCSSDLSLPLVVSNLVNIVSADYFDIDFAAYASVMVPVNLVSVAASLSMLMWFFRRDIPGRYEVAELKHPRSARKSVV